MWSKSLLLAFSSCEEAGSGAGTVCPMQGLQGLELLEHGQAWFERHSNSSYVQGLG